MSAQVVGEFPLAGLSATRRAIRAPVNPMDKCTIVSILPKRIEERKCTIQPGLFVIEAARPDAPTVLVVGTSSWWREIDESQPLLEIPVSSVQIAHSVVQDYCSGLLGCDMGDRMPGLFYIPGEYTVERVKAEHPVLLLDAARKQKNWFMELIRLADILWSRSNGNPLSISDDARLACKMLNITQKPWLGDAQTVELVPCVACGSLRNARFPICQTCKAVVDKDLAKKLDLTFAQ